jgi:beta-lactamase class A
VHGQAMDGSASLSLDADAPVVTPSTFKVFVALELFEQAADGRWDLSGSVVVDPKHRTYGPDGSVRFS